MGLDRGSEDAVVERVQRLEEALGFAQHEHEQLSAEVVSLGRRIRELSRRIESLENQSRERDAAAKQTSGEAEDPE